jgi:hypothetical protein
MLRSRNSNTTPTATGWLFNLPKGGPLAYRFSQLDDYSALARDRFLWKTGTTLSLRCRVSEPNLPGTWGFGLWNDPFTVALGLGGMGQRLPALPNCAWFFYASPENHLSFQPESDSKISSQNPMPGDTGLPSSGFLAQAFSAPRIPSLVFAPVLVAAPVLFFKPISKWLRAILAAKLIGEAAQRLDVDPTQWHEYRLQWGKTRVEFAIDGETVFETEISPKGPLGLVIWIDNQFAAWRPDGSLGMGTLPNPPAWMEIECLQVSQ